MANTASKLSKREWISLLIILLIGAALRFYQLDRSPLWLDEIWTLMPATGRGSAHLLVPVGTWIEHGEDFTALGYSPIWKIWTTLNMDVHPPLHFLLLRCWMMVVGPEDLAVRLYPAILSLACLPVLYFAARRTVGPVPALVATAIAAVAHVQVYHAQEVRSYTLLQLEFLVAVYVAIRIASEGATRGRLAALSLLFLAMAMTHYFFFGAALGLGVWLLVVCRGKERVREAMAGVVAVLLFVVLWGPQLKVQAGFMAGVQHLSAPDIRPLHALERIANFPARAVYLVDVRNPADSGAMAIFRRGWPILFGLIVLVGVPLAAWRWKEQRGVMVWWSCVVGTLGTLAAFDLLKGAGSLDLVRYVVHVTPAAFVCIAALVPAVAPTWVRLLPSVLAGLLTLTTLSTYGYNLKAPWRDVGRFIDSRAEPGDPVVYWGIDASDPRPATNYLCLTRYSRTARENPHVLLQAARPPDAATLERLRRAGSTGRVFVVSSVSARLMPPTFGLEPVEQLQQPEYTGDAAESVWVLRGSTEQPRSTP